MLPLTRPPLVAPPYPGWARHVWQRICSIDDAPGGRPVRRRRSGTVRAVRDEEARQGGRLRTCGHRRGRDRCCYIKETAPRKSAPATADWTAPGCAAERARVNTASARNAGARGTRRRAHREQKPDEPKFVSEREQREDHPHRKQVDGTRFHNHDRFCAGTGTPGIFTLTVPRTVRLTKYSVFQSSPPKPMLLVAG
jgi:hypothetical protein